jgi:hypothetical protein
MYWGHTAAVTCTKFLPLEMYVPSGDARGWLRIWSYDHNKHLPRLDVQVLVGLVRDVCWDHEGVWVAVCGDGGAQSAELSRVVMRDTGVKCGNLQAHGRRRGSTWAIRLSRPTRVATGGAEDPAVYFHTGHPFKRVARAGGRHCHPRQEVPCKGGCAPPAGQPGRLNACECGHRRIGVLLPRLNHGA